MYVSNSTVFEHYIASQQLVFVDILEYKELP